MVVRKGSLPEHLRNIPAKHLSRKLPPEQYSFPGNDYVLLHNYQLTEYIHPAKWAAIIEDFEDRSIIELRYDWTEQAEDNWQYPPAYQYNWPPKTNITASEAQAQAPESEEEWAIIHAYELLRDANNKQLALTYAITGKSFWITSL